MVMTEVRKYMEAAVEKLTPAKAQEMAKSLVQGQGQRREQVQKVAQDLMEWSNQTRERISEMIRREVARQLETIGVASKQDLEALTARVRTLERRGSRGTNASSTTRIASTAKPTAKRPATAKKASSKTPPATSVRRRSTAGPSTAAPSDEAGS